MRAVVLLVFCVVFAFCQNIKIATYNVENLFDGVNNCNEYSDFRIGKGKWSKEKARQKLLRIKEVITALDADIIAIQEVENEEVLKELIAGTNYKYINFSTSKNAPVGLGVISKIKPSSSEAYKVHGIKTRDILRVKFKLQDGEFSLFVVHFPAFKRNGLEAQKRAERTLRVALAQHKNAIALGDFNTVYSTSDRSLLYNITTTKNYTNLWSEVREYKQRYSYARSGSNKRAIDHVLLSPEFMDKKGQFVYVCDSFKVFKPNFMMDGEYAKNEKNLSVYSDHLPLVFEISTDKNLLCGIMSKFLNRINM
ncbi:endonuclease/exonuclease/phosphatase family protein [Campylobacter sp. 7477a]|uniref:endonuclease/exonuclease/phosphatase family protein n=1 Tax=Campylobacter sp. 7477a TaxID=2735741 RepID=UPI00301463CF|nr:endonuclease/exonuclease/phosphatase family protein [Campylobacter sp. 7477a]